MSTQTLQPTEVQTGSVQALQVDLHCAGDAIPAAMQKGFGTLMSSVAAHGIQFAGAPRAIYTGMGPDGVDFTLAIPIAPTSAQVAPPARVGELPAANTLRFTHVGAYEHLMRTYGEVTAWMIENGRMESEADWGRYMPMWEEYVSDPQHTPPDQLITHIHLPLGE